MFLRCKVRRKDGKQHRYLSSSRHLDQVAYNGAEVLAHVIVTGFVRLYATYFVGGPRHEDVRAPLARIPEVRPAHPHEPIAGLLDVGGMPGFSTVDANL